MAELGLAQFPQPVTPVAVLKNIFREIFLISAPPLLE